MKKSHFKNLIEKYLNKDTNSNETILLDRYYDKLSDSKEILELSTDANLEQKLLKEINHKIDLLESAQQQNTSKRIKISPIWFRAAAILTIISTVSYFFYHSKVGKQKYDTDFAKNILPGGNRATLKLSNGKRLDLTDAKNGTLATLGSAIANKVKDGELSFVSLANEEDNLKEEINTLDVPAGGFYKLMLSDGTKVWLNSSSSLSFATNFTGNKRLVKLTGEAYFEVAHNPEKPFIVETEQQQIEVLGTHFNINAYHDEETTRTTLMEGSVKVVSHNQTNRAYLKPGEQASLLRNTIDVNKVDVNQSIDWVNGRFNLNQTDIQSVMRKISRWYNIEVSYQGNFDGVVFGGKISKNKNLRETLNMLSRTGDVKFKVTGRRVVVMP